mgnify:CR=1 FL=1
MKINNKYNISDTVYVKNDIEQLPCVVIAINVYVHGISYNLRVPDLTVSEFYEFEISDEIDIMLKTNN